MNIRNCVGATALLAISWAITSTSGEHGPRPELFGPGDGDTFWVFPESAENLGNGGAMRVFVDTRRHPDALTSFAEFSLGPGGSLPVHRHDRTEEVGYFTAGSGVVIEVSDGELVRRDVVPGHVWYIPPGAWHAVENTGGDPLSLVFATTPNDPHGLLSFFRKIGVEPGENADPMTPEAFAALAAEHDLILRPAPESD